MNRSYPKILRNRKLNLAYNALLDGQRLEDIELRRNDEAFLESGEAVCRVNAQACPV